MVENVLHRALGYVLKDQERNLRQSLDLVKPPIRKLNEKGCVMKGRKSDVLLGSRRLLVA